MASLVARGYAPTDKPFRSFPWLGDTDNHGKWQVARDFLFTFSQHETANQKPLYYICALSRFVSEIVTTQFFRPQGRYCHVRWPQWCNYVHSLSGNPFNPLPDIRQCTVPKSVWRPVSTLTGGFDFQRGFPVSISRVTIAPKCDRFQLGAWDW